MLWGLMHWAWRVGNMPATFGGQLTVLISIATLITLMAGVRKTVSDYIKEERRKAIEDSQHREWLEELWLEKCRKDGTTLSDELIRKHMRINGNDKKSSVEKDRIYGNDRPQNSRAKSHKAGSDTD